MGASFESAKELREVIDEVFTMMDADPEMGPKLRDADTPQRFEFSDFDLVVNIRAAREGEEGKENVPMAVARRRIKTGGDLKKALALIPITKPIYDQYRAYLEREKPHLKV